MHHRPARVIVTILAVALLATTFGDAADGKRAEARGLALPPTTVDIADQRDLWCGSMSNAPGLSRAAADLKGLTVEDDESLAVIEAATQRPMSLTEARRIGSEYAALRETWDRWEQLCVIAYSGRS